MSHLKKGLSSGNDERSGPDSDEGKSNNELKCPVCSYINNNVNEMEVHINRQHLDPSCPICEATFPNADALETHVNTKHMDVTTPMKESATLTKESETDETCCPVCNSFTSKSLKKLNEHIDLHFSAKDQSRVLSDASNHSDKSHVLPETSSDFLVAQELARKFESEQREFRLLQAQYGMNNDGNFKEQSITNMQRAVCSGELTVPDYYEKEVELKLAEKMGIDDQSSCVKDPIPRIKEKSKLCSNVVDLLICSSVDFYARSYGDSGWGCGYRNLQMLLSSLFRNETYNELLSKQLSSKFNIQKLPSGNSMPCVSKLQQMIEWAWDQGFDTAGRQQLGGKLCNTRKWIGSTEIVALLSALKFRCQLIDVHRPSADGLHHNMFNWIKNYFQKSENFKPPLYLQHEGHSRTVIGIEILKTGDELLLILDPGIRKNIMEKALSAPNPFGTLNILRKSLHNMKNQQYQIATVVGIVGSKQEYQDRKVVRSQRIS